MADARAAWCFILAMRFVMDCVCARVTMLPTVLSLVCMRAASRSATHTHAHAGVHRVHQLGGVTRGAAAGCAAKAHRR
jgi:hypothetical protein